MTIYDLSYEDEWPELYKILLNPKAVIDPSQTELNAGMCIMWFLQRTSQF